MKLMSPPTGRSNGHEYFKQLTAARRWGGRLLLFVAFGLLALQLWINASTIEKSKALAVPNSFYDQLKSDKADYSPGDIIRFDFTRTTKLPTSDYPLLLLTIDSFENLETGELFPAAVNARIIFKEGTETLKATRRIPDYVTPGRYIFIGWSSSQTQRQTAASYYFSNHFMVSSNKSRQ